MINVYAHTVERMFWWKDIAQNKIYIKNETVGESGGCCECTGMRRSMANVLTSSAANN